MNMCIWTYGFLAITLPGHTLKTTSLTQAESINFELKVYTLNNCHEIWKCHSHHIQRLQPTYWQLFQWNWINDKKGKKQTSPIPRERSSAITYPPVIGKGLKVQWHSQLPAPKQIMLNRQARNSLCIQVDDNEASKQMIYLAMWEHKKQAK